MATTTVTTFTTFTTSYLHPLTARAFSTCPSGKAFYACHANGFEGCCSSDPCNSDGCVDDTLPSDMSSSDTGDASKTASASDSNADDVVTHTIPNTNVITITSHTTVTLPQPESSTGAATTSLSNTTPLSQSPSPTNSPATPANSSNATSTSSPGSDEEGFSTGAIAGVGVGGAVVVVIIIALLFFCLRRRRRNRRDSTSTASQRGGQPGDDRFEDKHFPQAMSAHTTGTQDDPFAPFGGRADKSPQSNQSAKDTVIEMEANSIAPVELPATCVNPARTNSPKVPTPLARPPPTPLNNRPISETDPRSNLRSLGSDNGQPAYVNHWNSYRAMGGGGGGGG